MLLCKHSSKSIVLIHKHSSTMESTSKHISKFIAFHKNCSKLIALLHKQSSQSIVLSISIPPNQLHCFLNPLFAHKHSFKSIALLHKNIQTHCVFHKNCSKLIVLLQKHSSKSIVLLHKHTSKSIALHQKHISKSI